ncbi:hypothetical protein K402DRAFT_329854 [Aulographum hederae CBS 113979]|uniref:Velvet domain-containing protein n=1 Tax=Aulographum hederae CBS 113979 TaxID=1176131 RepID=A0A6G1H402_9PEZI|nr:hypothetical protein K402DRAFT_329854 [Aulographum hederae CBS 113979]
MSTNMFRLEVHQQPIRARMCGFGDKDRRPITPPPCIKLLVFDNATQKEVDYNAVESTYFVLTVDLWNDEGNQEVNLVRHSSTSPAVSISNATTGPYPPNPERPMNMALVQQAYGQYGQSQGMAIAGGYYTPASSAPQSAYPYPNPSMGNPVMQPSYTAQPHIPQNISFPTHPASGMFTRNLIGSLSVNAFKLIDTESKVGFWFVLQDLSVRTEGLFRLKMNFVDVGAPDGNGLNKAHAPVLATVFSDKFQVYSAKKFPGVIESTPLSKAFAQQGIKIPIRKDGPKADGAKDEYDDAD